MKRMAYWDVVKGIAITAIVVGHASASLHDFVYTWHLAIFIFLTGYLYSADKYGEHPWEYMGHKTGQNWTKYVCYSTIILLIYLAVKRVGFIEGQEFTIKELFFEWINILFLGGGVPLQGTLWFVPMLLLCTGMFCAVIYWQKKIPLLNNNVVLLAICFIVGISGVWITNQGTDLKYFLNISMIMLPVCACGYIRRKKCSDLTSLLIIPIGLIGGGTNYLFAYILNWDINLASNNTAGYKFYIVTFAGIYMALTLSKVFVHFKITRIIFSFLGKYSFEIMAFHFSVFKIIDSIYGRLFPGRISPEILMNFPTAGTVTPVVYITLGCAIPAFAGHSISRFGKAKNI